MSRFRTSDPVSCIFCGSVFFSSAYYIRVGAALIADYQVIVRVEVFVVLFQATVAMAWFEFASNFWLFGLGVVS